MRRGLLALALAAVLLAALDLALRAAGALPPDDPLLFFVRTREPVVDPFVPAGEGEVAIRADWVNDGEGLRGRRGVRAGRQFLLPGFRPARLAIQKPPGTLRVFALGGSTTYGLYVGGEDAFPAVLERSLARRLPSRDVEMVNLGCPGFASDRVLALLRSVLRLDPDLVVVLTGHNEMLGGEMGPAAGLTAAQRLRARLLRSSSLFAWWNHWLAGTLRSARTEAVREEAAALAAGQIPTYVPEEVPGTRREAPSDAFRARAAERYAENLAAMARVARDAGVPILFALPAANLRAAPARLGSDAGPDPRREAALRAARALLEAGDAERALARTDEALALADDAEVRSLRGDALLALGREAEARRAYQAALDRDVRTHRITGSAADAATRVFGALRKGGAAWVDLRPVLLSDLGADAAQRLFVDHVHPTAEGHAAIAAALLPEALRLLEEPAARTGPAL